MKIVYVRSINEYIDAINNNNEVLIADCFYDEFIKYIKENRTTNKLNELFYNFFVAINKINASDILAAKFFLENEAFESENKDAYYFLGCIYKYSEKIRDYKKAYIYFKKAIEYGSMLSSYELGELYYRGKGVIQSYEEAVKLFQKAADNNYTDAQYNLGMMYYHGKGVAQSNKKAINLLTLAADNNYIDAQYILGLMYYNGKDVTQSYVEATKWFIKAADNNYAQAQYNLGLMFYNGIGVTQSYDKAFKWYQKAAYNNNAEAQYKFGLMYFNGEGVTKSYEAAAKWYRKAADNNYAQAQYNLGLMYFKGDGVVKSYEEAIKWYKKAADNNYAKAQYNLGLMYLNGEGVTQSYEKAVKWFIKSAENNYSQAQYNLGYIYYKGTGVAQSYEKAAKWYKEAAKNGDIDAQYVLGNLYYDGEGVVQSYEKAIKWYRRAADNNYAKAQLVLGIFYSSGVVVTQSYEEAAKWLIKAADNNDAQAQYILGLMFLNGLAFIKSYEEAIKLLTLSANQGYIQSIELLGYHYYTQNDLEKAYYWLLKAEGNGSMVYQKQLDDIIEKLQTLKEKKRLHLLERKDVFISWNHNDIVFKDKFCDKLEELSINTVWESDGDGIGDLDDTIKTAISNAKSYIIIVSPNSIKSEWVKKEINEILRKCEISKEYDNCIRPIYLNNAENLIKDLPDDNPFKKLYNLASSFFGNEEKLYDRLKSFILKAIDISLKLEYKEIIKNKFLYFNSALINRVSKTDAKSGIIASALDFENGYINRPLYLNDIEFDKSIFEVDKPVLIYGEGGIGKSLYLKNIVRNEFLDNRYFFYVPLKDIEANINNNEKFIDILKEKAFDCYFSLKDTKLISKESFEAIFTQDNKVYILLDAMDEINETSKKSFIKLLNDFNSSYKDVHYISTSRNKSDALIFNEALNKETLTLQLKGFSFNDVTKLYDSLAKKYIKREDSLILNDMNFSKNYFITSLNSFNEEVKKNPLLISNLIFIYFATNKLPNKPYNVLGESVAIMIKDVEEDRNISFKYSSYLNKQNLSSLLEYLAYARSINDIRSTVEIFEEFLKDSSANVDNYYDAANSIYEYLIRRNIIVGDSISHTIFKDFFASCYIFNNIYAKKNYGLMNKYLAFNENGKETLKGVAESKFSLDYDNWPSITVDFIMKVDYEIHSFNNEFTINENNLSYETFSYTLHECLNNASNLAIETLNGLLDTDGLYYKDLISSYLEKVNS